MKHTKRLIVMALLGFFCSCAGMARGSIDFIFHTPAQLNGELKSLAPSHPSIAHTFSIGNSVNGFPQNQKEDASTRQRKLTELVRPSRFIFIGTVRQFDAATMRDIPATERTAIVKVDEILHQPGTLENLTGQEITVQFARPHSMKPGERAVFFTNGSLYGKSIVVVEAGRLSAGRDTSVLREEIEASLQRIADNDLAARLNRAALVVSGTVSEIRAVEQARQLPETEHNPEWRQAVVEIETVEKGALTERTLAILFPSSYDEVWMDSPKFKVGQRGIWIIQKDQEEKGWPVLRLPGYTALNPLDFQPLEQLDRIKRLLNSKP